MKISGVQQGLLLSFSGFISGSGPELLLSASKLAWNLWVNLLPRRAFNDDRSVRVSFFYFVAVLPCKVSLSWAVLGSASMLL